MSITHFSGPVVIGADTFFTPVAAKTLTAKDNGKIFTIATTGYTYTLPAVFAGAYWKFVTQALFDTNFVLDGGVDLIYGQIDVNSTLVQADAATAINVVAASDTIGDWFEIWSDGTNWYVDGDAFTAGGITVTA